MPKSLKKFLDPGQISLAITEVRRHAEQSGVKVVLVGGVALQLYGSDRLTVDVDFVANDVFMMLDGFKSLSIGGFQGRTSAGTPVDVLLGGKYPDLYPAIINDAVYFPEVGVKVATLEGLMAMKLAAGRIKDEEDIRSMLALGEVDLAAARAIIEEAIGSYAVGDFDSFVDEVSWKMERDARRAEGRLPTVKRK